MHVVKRTMTVCLERGFSEACRLLVSLFVLLFSSSSYATCTDWIARVVSIQGNVDVRVVNTAQWKPVELQQVYCSGDTLRVQANSRAALELHNDTILRLNQNSTLVLSGPKKEASWLDLLKGSLHSISRVPRSLKIETPFVNAAVEGTEFLVQVDSDNTLVGVIEGKVAVANEFGRILLAKDQSAITYKGKAPVLRLDIRPADSVQWSLYYPSLNVVALKPAEDLLRVGQVDAARSLLQQQSGAEALALRSIIAIAGNNKDAALQLAEQAIQADTSSAVTHLAHSYALQARFDLPAAMKAAEQAIKQDTKDAIAWARLAELHLSLEELDKGLAAAGRAVELDPQLARTQTMLGFAYLLQYSTAEAKAAFKRSIELDSADPLARLGNGLATIREGNLVQGRREIEIAASLDANNSQIRSYLGKAYLEEKRNRLAAEQFALAKEMDPKDPTPWLYSALLKHTQNRPVDALRELEHSIRLNNNRAVYRSSLLLDSDQATRGAGLGRIYQDLGFEQLALNEATKSLAADQANASAHRLLADAYLSRTQHEIARVSELLQAQMLQPINTTPLQPQMSESTLTLLNNLGTDSTGFNEYSSLFMRNQARVGTNVLSAGNNTFGGEFIVSGVMDKFSISAAKYSYETDGFHANNEDDQLLENVFLQYAATPSTSLLFEISNNDREYGDLLRFDPANFSRTLNNIRDVSRRRVGLTHRFSPRSMLLLTAMKEDRFQQRLQGAGFLTIRDDTDFDSVAKEMRYIVDEDLWDLTFGYSYNKSTSSGIQRRPFSPPRSVSNRLSNSTVYAYLYPVLDDMRVTVGMTRDHFKSTSGNRDNKANSKKFGLELDLNSDAVFRLGYFETFTRPILNNQTLEPTSVSGFNQFYDDANGTRAKNRAVALDYRLSDKLKSGVEIRERDLRVPFALNGPIPTTGIADWNSASSSMYAYWLPRNDLAVNIGINQEKLDRDRSLTTNVRLLNSTIYRLPIGINWFHDSGWIGRAKLTYVKQKAQFIDIFTNGVSSGRDNFVVVDADIEYRFRNGMGSFSLGALNLFDESFNYQDADENRQLFSPGRVAFMRLNLLF